MKKGKTVYDDHGGIIFSRQRYYEYVLDEERTEEEILNEYIKEFYVNFMATVETSTTIDFQTRV